MSRKPFKTVGEIRSKHRLQLVHSDVCSMEVDSIGGSRYFVTFIDDFNRRCAVYFIKHKSEVLAKLKLLEAEISNHTKETIQFLRSDRGGEYLSNEFTQYLQSNGIPHELTVASSP